MKFWEKKESESIDCFILTRTCEVQLICFFSPNPRIDMGFFVTQSSGRKRGIIMGSCQLSDSTFFSNHFRAHFNWFFSGLSEMPQFGHLVVTPSLDPCYVFSPSTMM